MRSETPRKTLRLDSFAAHALKTVNSKADYNRIAAANTLTDVEAAWQTLSSEDRQRISNICNVSPQPDLSAMVASRTAEGIAQDLVSCDTYLQLQAVKAEHGEDAARAAWRLIPVSERQRLKVLCDNGQQQLAENQQPVIEQPSPYQVEPQLQQSKPDSPRRTLFSISNDLEKLNDLLDEAGDDTQQQELIAQWFETPGEERDAKLDNYSALIVEMTSRAAARKAEAHRTHTRQLARGTSL